VTQVHAKKNQTAGKVTTAHTETIMIGAFEQAYADCTMIATLIGGVNPSYALTSLSYGFLNVAARTCLSDITFLILPDVGIKTVGRLKISIIQSTKIAVARILALMICSAQNTNSKIVIVPVQTLN
jgi:hypothetical protein